MASAAIWAAVTTFLEADIITGVNAEQTGALVAGSVTTARAPRGSSPRRANAFPLSVEIVPVTPWPRRELGPDDEEVVVLADLHIDLRSKALAQGKTQLTTVENVARALARRYQGRSNLAITISGATFVDASAEVRALDDVSEAELERAVVRLALTFTEALAANT